MTCSRRVLLTVLSVVSISACLILTAETGDSHPEVAVPIPGPQTAGYRTELHAALPDEISGMTRNDPQPASDLTAGWGRTIVLRCGVSQPGEDADPEADGVEVGHVSWSFARESDGSARLTTTLRKAYVEVTLRGSYAYDSSPLLDLAPAMEKSVPEGIA